MSAEPPAPPYGNVQGHPVSAVDAADLEPSRPIVGLCPYPEGALGPGTPARCAGCRCAIQRGDSYPARAVLLCARCYVIGLLRANGATARQVAACTAEFDTVRATSDPQEFTRTLGAIFATLPGMRISPAGARRHPWTGPRP